MNRRLAGALAGLLLLALPASAQTPDSTAAAPAVPPALAAPSVLEAPADTAHSPTRALRRSLLAPGWGQVTNGQAIKAPVVVAALVGAAGVLVYQQRRYGLYQRAAFFAGCQEVPDRGVCADAESARDAWVETGSRSRSVTEGIRNQTRGRRDISGLAVVVVYALQALDAYVAAQLIGFDVSEDVAVRAAPGGLSLRVRL